MKLPRPHRHLSLIVGAAVCLISSLLVARVIAQNKVRDLRKRDIETPTKRILAKQSDPASKTTGDKFVNPKVQPGKVRWHKDFDAACAAASKSGKPVLLFQMMGKLDEQFC